MDSTEHTSLPMAHTTTNELLPLDVPHRKNTANVEAGKKGRASVKLCSGKKKNGEACGLIAKKGRDYCRRHGGNLPKGVAHHNYVNGSRLNEREKRRRKQGDPTTPTHRYRTHMPQTLLEVMEQASMDPEIHSLHQDIALQDTLLSDLLRRRFDAGDPGKGWKQFHGLWKELLAAEEVGDVLTMQQTQGAITALLDKMQQCTLLESDIREQQRLVADLRTKEHKRLMDLQAHIPIEAFVQYLKGVTLGIRKVLFAYLPQSDAERIMHHIREEMRTLELRQYLGTAPAQPSMPLIARESALPS